MSAEAFDDGTITTVASDAPGAPTTNSLVGGHEIIFIDAAIDDADQLLAQLTAGSAPSRRFDIIRLDAARDGIAQVTETLAARSQLDALHFVTHGASGSLQLGATHVDMETMSEHAATISRWGDALKSDADLFLYGCDIAADSAGRELLGALARLARADVAASTDRTGHAAAGGDWDLEYRRGDVADGLVLADSTGDWMGSLAAAVLAGYEVPFSVLDDTGYEIRSDQAWGQTFWVNSPGETYEVNAIELVLSRASDAPPQTITVSIRSWDWSGTPLASASISSASLATSEKWEVFDLGAVTLTDGQLYRIRIDSSGPGRVYLGVDPATPLGFGNLADNSGLPLLNRDAAHRVLQTLSPPVASNLSADEMYTEDGGAVDLTDIVISDTDSADLSATLTLSDPAAGSLSTGTSGGATSTFSGGVWSASGPITHVNALLASVSFIPNPNYSATFDIATSVSDGASSVTGTKTFTGIPVNDSPTIALTNVIPALGETAATIGPIKLADVVVTDDVLGTQTLALSGADAALFQLVGSKLFLRAGTPLDFETKPTLDVVVTVDDITVGTSPDDFAPLSLAIIDMNEPPSASAESYTSAEDVTLDVPAGAGVLANDIDIDSASLTAVLVSAPAHGTLLLGADGAFRYRPDSDFAGNDSFTYRVSDGTALSAIATASISVAATNDAPVAGRDAYALVEDERLTVAAGGLLANDSDADGDVLTVTLRSEPRHGALTLGADGTFSYLPGADFTGEDTFTYAVHDAGGHMASATVLLTVAAAPDAPLALTAEVSSVPPAAYVFSLRDFRYADADGDALAAVRILSIPHQGALQLDGQVVAAGAEIAASAIAAGRFEYAPPRTDGATIVEQFDFAVSDGTLWSHSASMTVAVAPFVGVPVTSTDNNASAENQAPVFEAEKPPANVAAQDSPIGLAVASTATATASTASASVSSSPAAVAPVTAGARGKLANSQPQASVPAGAATPVPAEAAAGNAVAVNATVESIFAMNPAANAKGDLAPVHLDSDWRAGASVGVAAPSIAEVSRHEATAADQAAADAIKAGSFRGELDRIRADTEERISAQRFATGSVLIASSTVSVGYVLWLLRGGILLSSLLSSLPAWRFIDPLPVLSRFGAREDDADDDSLEDLVAQARARGAHETTRAARETNGEAKDITRAGNDLRDAAAEDAVDQRCGRERA